MANGVAKHIIENGVNALAKHVEKNIGTTKNGGHLNGVGNKIRQQNGVVNHLMNHNGVANGAANGVARHLLQNGVGHLANGNNRVAPLNANNAKDPLRNMYNEVEGYRQDLHI